MKKMKKLIGLLLVVALVGAAVGGTLAYLQDTDSDVNVMTLGNVYIEQHEYEREINADGTYKTDTIDGKTSYILKDFTQAKPLLPIVGDPNEPGNSPAYAGYDSTIVRMTQVDSYGSMEVFAGKNAQDKFVTVENTGKSDAYVRTLVAIECGTGDAGLIGTGTRCVPAKDAATSTSPWVSNEIGTISVENNTFILFEYVYRGASDVPRHVNGVLPAGDTSYPNLCQVYLKHNATNEDMEAIDGNNNGTLDILVLSQAVQAEGFADAETALDTAFGKASEKAAEWFGGMAVPSLVNSVEELQTALDNAANGDTITLGADITGNVIVTQKRDVAITIDGNGKTFEGFITVDGKSATYTTAGLTIKNVNFKAEGITVDACINLGDGTNATRYTCNVTVSDCTFDVPGAVGVKSYTGGDKNLTITGCEITANCHSLVQAKGIDGILVDNCVVSSKNGLNFNNSDNVTVSNCSVDTKGYCVRFGESSGGAGAAETYLIKDCTLKSACEDGDAVIILRGTADNATLTIENTTLDGTTEITNTATGATVIK